MLLILLHIYIACIKAFMGIVDTTSREVINSGEEERESETIEGVHRGF